MIKELPKHSHELRVHDYRKGPNHVEVVCKGSEDECRAHAAKIAKEMGEGFGVGYVLSNGGYKLIDLAEERKQKIEKAGPDLLKVLVDLLESVNPVFNKANEGELGFELGEYIATKGIPSDASIRSAITAIKKATE